MFGKKPKRSSSAPSALTSDTPSATSADHPRPSRSNIKSCLAETTLPPLPNNQVKSQPLSQYFNREGRLAVYEGDSWLRCLLRSSEARRRRCSLRARVRRRRGPASGTGGFGRTPFGRREG